ncbi:MAG: hypothetical protein Q4Q51_07490 [Eubacteriales bacterium]|nr:hypothetical protein [Eubacteriales bacterium]
MDDLDLEKLKKELHDVSGSSLYDVDQIMEEAGSSESGSRASMEQLLQSLGVQTQEQQEQDTLDSLQQASEQTQAMIEEQQEMQQWLKPEEAKEAEQPDEDDVFGSLFAQLGELEREETPTDPRLTEPLLEPEEEPSLMERLFPSEPEVQADTEPETQILEPEPDIPTRRMNRHDYEDLIEQATLRVQQSEEDDEEDVSAEKPETQETVPEQKLNTSNDEAISQIVEALSEQPEQAAQEQKEEQPEKQGLLSRLFAPPDVVEDAADADALDEEGREEATEQPENPEPSEETTQPPTRKGLFSRLFSTQEELEEVETPIDLTRLQGLDEAAPESLSEEESEQPEEEPETQILEPEQPEKELETEQEQLEQETPKEVFAQLLDDEPEESEQPNVPEQPQEPEREPEKPKAGIFDRVMDALGFELVEEGEEAPEQPQPSEPAQETEPESVQQQPEKQPPQPRPEDTPVISEDEFAAFMSDVDAGESEQCASFEQLLEDSMEETSDEKQKVLRKKPVMPEEFPDEETTVYVDVPVRKQVLEHPQPRQTELFDVEEALKQKPLFERSQEQEEPEQEPEQEPDEPLPEPEWLGKPLEEICKTAPSLEVLRKEGPVMTREVLRCKEWITERIRRYQAEQRGEPYPPQPESEPQSEPKMEPIHASEALDEMHEQEQAEEDSVFPEGSTGKPETEAADQKPSTHESVIEIQASETKTEQPARSAAENTAADRKQKPKSSVKKKIIRRDWTQESRVCRLRARNKALRSTILGVLTLICIYISCAADFTILPLPSAMDYASHSGRVLGVFLLLLACALVLAYDVVWDGIRAVLQGSPNFATLADAALLLNILHCCIRLASEGEEIPFACIAMLILFAQLRAQVSEETIKHYTYKVAGAAREPIGIFCRRGKTPHLVKAPLADINTFAAQTTEQEERKRMERLFTLSALAAAVILSVIVCASTGDAGRLIYVLTATVTGSCQVALLSASVMARQSAARRLAHCGAASDSDEGSDKLATTQTVVLTDEDLFPNGSVVLVSLELHSNLNDATALAYAAALTQGSSLGNMLAEEVRTRYGAPLAAHRVLRYDGGVGGQIGGLQVLLGNERFMTSRGVSVSGMTDNALALSLDGSLAAVLTVDYTVPAVLFHAMQKLTEQKTTIWLNSHNQQITPQLVEQLYGLPKGTVVVPELECSRALQNPARVQDARLCALLMRDGLMGIADCICAARAQRKAQRAGVLIGICASIVCMLLMMYLCYAFVPSDAHPIRLLIYMVLCFIPIFFLDNGVGRE